MTEQTPFQSQGTKLLRALLSEGKRIFTLSDVQEASKHLSISSAQIRKIVSTLAKQHKIMRLRKGVYITLGLLPEETIDIHPFVISSFLVQPSAISHWSALQHHGLTEQIPQVISASTLKKVVTPSMRCASEKKSESKHAWVIDDIQYEFITIQKKHWFGFEMLWLDEFSRVQITDKERTIIDLFAHPKVFGGIGEAIGILESNIETLDLKKLVQYAIQFDNKALIKRLGWSLEQFGAAKKILKPLCDIAADYYTRLDPAKPPIGPCDNRWMIQNNFKE